MYVLIAFIALLSADYWVSCQLDTANEGRSAKETAASLGPSLAGDVYSELISETFHPRVNEECVFSNKEQQEEYGLMEVNDKQSGFFSQLYDMGSRSVATVYRTAKTNVFDKSAKLVGDFAEKVKEIVHEELYIFLQGSMRSLGDALLTPGATLYYLGQTAMSVSILFICLLSTYLFFNLFSFLFIGAFNASIFLLHQLFGPEWIFDHLIWFLHNVGCILWFMMEHYYVSTVLVVIVSVYSVLLPIIRWCTQRTAMQQATDIETRIVEIGRRMDSMERNQEEMLFILRRLDSCE